MIFTQNARLRADSPAAQAAAQATCGRGLVAGCDPQIAGAEKAAGKSSHSSAVTGQRVFFVSFAAFACGVKKEENVMDDGAGPQPNLNRPDPFVFGEIEQQREIAIDIRPVRGN